MCKILNCQNIMLSKKFEGCSEKFEFRVDVPEVSIFLITPFCKKFQMKLAIFLQYFIHHKPFAKQYRATATVVAAPIFPKKTLLVPQSREYISDKSCLPILYFSFDLNFFSTEQSLSRIIYLFSWAIQIRCRTLHFVIRKTCYVTWKYDKIAPEIVSSAAASLDL